MDYEETLTYLFAQLPMYQRIGAAAYRADLSNTIRLAAMVGNPEEGLRCVHIAGTNGKGSTAHSIAAILQANGYRTGLMTSPHYKDFRERIRVDGQMIEKGFIVSFIERYKRRFEGFKPSFFELTVIMGFDYFQSKGVDIAIIETGMGGRLDSTNIVRPELSIITPIGMDHQAFLGDTVEKIAMEKAGIIKQGTPVLISEGNESLIPLFQRVAQDRSAPFHVCQKRNEEIPSDLSGPYQQQNLNTALSAVDILERLGWTLDAEKVHAGLEDVRGLTGFMGRWQVLGASPTVLADAAHNEAGIRALLDSLEIDSNGRLHIVLAMVSDKDVDHILGLFPKDAMYYFTQAKVIRAMDKESLAETASRCGLQGGVHPNVREALDSAKDKATEADTILITGSVFTVAEVI